MIGCSSIINQDTFLPEKLNMKFLILKAFLFVLLALPFTATAQRSQLAGTWKIDKEALMPELRQAFLESARSHANAGEAVPDEAEIEQVVATMAEMFGQMEMELLSDGTYRQKGIDAVTGEPDESTGTWSYDNGKMVTVEDGTEEESTGVLEVISPDKFKVRYQGEEQDGMLLYEITMVRVK